MNIKRIGKAVTIAAVVTTLIVVTKAISVILTDLIRDEHSLTAVIYRLGFIGMILIITALALTFLTYEK